MFFGDGIFILMFNASRFFDQTLLFVWLDIIVTTVFRTCLPERAIIVYLLLPPLKEWSHEF